MRNDRDVTRGLRSPGWLATRLTLGALAAACGLMAWVLRPWGDGGTQPAPEPREPGHAAAWQGGEVLPRHGPGSSLPPLDAPAGWRQQAKPGFMSAASWSSLLLALESQPERAEELARIVAYRRFQSSLDGWRAAQATQSAQSGPLREGLARQLVSELPQRVLRRELSGPEAVMLVDELSRTFASAQQAEAFTQAAHARLLAAQAQLSAAAQATEAADQAKHARYLRLEAEVLQQWLALAPAQRDQASLERQLDAARQAAYRH